MRRILIIAVIMTMIGLGCGGDSGSSGGSTTGGVITDQQTAMVAVSTVMSMMVPAALATAGQPDVSTKVAETHTGTFYGDTGQCDVTSIVDDVAKTATYTLECDQYTKTVTVDSQTYTTVVDGVVISEWASSNNTATYTIMTGPNGQGSLYLKLNDEIYTTSMNVTTTTSVDQQAQVMTWSVEGYVDDLQMNSSCTLDVQNQTITCT